MRPNIESLVMNLKQTPDNSFRFIVSESISTLNVFVEHEGRNFIKGTKITWGFFRKLYSWFLWKCLFLKWFRWSLGSAPFIFWQQQNTHTFPLIYYKNNVRSDLNDSNQNLQEP